MIDDAELMVGGANSFLVIDRLTGRKGVDVEFLGGAVISMLLEEKSQLVAVGGYHCLVVKFPGNGQRVLE